jgi:hypothetical protein
MKKKKSSSGVRGCEERAQVKKIKAKYEKQNFYEIEK